jgi:ATP-dependent RNA circularization protein (DNA/RNA ligase family)
LGKGIQSDIYKLPEHRFLVFSVYDIEDQEYLDYNEFIEFCNKYGFDTVPILNDNYELNHSVDDLIKEAIGFSKLSPKVQREGIVIRAKKEAFDEELGRLSFKVINQKHLLKYEE